MGIDNLRSTGIIFGRFPSKLVVTFIQNMNTCMIFFAKNWSPLTLLLENFVVESVVLLLAY